MYLIIHWYINTIKKFLKLKKKCTVFIVISSILLQVLQLASFIIPLKMLFILTSESEFSYAVSSFVIDTKAELAVLMTLVVAFLLLFMVVLEKITFRLRYKCSEDIWKNSKKLHLYHNQEQVATNIYTQVTNSLSASLFIFLILSALMYIYAIIPFVLLSYWAIAFVVVIWLVNHNKNFEKNIEEDLFKIVNTVSLLGFLVVFVSVVVDLLSANPLGSIAHAVIAIILVRHLSGSVSQFIINVRNLFKQKVQLQSIFFNEQAALLAHHSKDDFLELFHCEEYKNWIDKVLKDTLTYEFECNYYEWYDFGVPNVVTLVVTIQRKENENIEERFFIKIYNKNLQTQAINDATLYTGCNLDELSPSFLGASMIETFHCHIFDFSEYSILKEVEFQEQKMKMFKKIAYFDLSDKIIKQYRKTHQLIYERFEIDKLLKISIGINTKDKEILAWFQNNIDNIKHNISTLPLRVVVANMGITSIVLDQKQEPKLLNFMNWRLEPQGFNLVTIHDKKMLHSIVNAEEYRLALIVSYLKLYEHSSNFNRLHEAMEYLKIIKELYESTSHQVSEKNDDEFILLLKQMNDEMFLVNMLNKCTDGNFRYKQHKWYELGIQNILAYTISVVDEASGDEHKYLIKIFNKNFSAKAISEENLYKKVNIDVLSIPFVTATEIDEYKVHIFRYAENYQPVVVEEFNKKRFEIFEQINNFDIDKQFIDKYYKEERKFIYERFTLNNFQYLRMVCKDDGENILLWFEENLDRIIADIKTLKFRLVVPFITTNSLLENSQNEFKLLSFHNWSIEPLGFSFMSMPELKILESMTTESDYKKALVVHYLRFCEREYNANKFYDVLKILKKIKDVYTNE